MSVNLNASRHGRPDTVQLASVFLVILISIAFVYSARVVGDAGSSFIWYKQLYVRQMFWFAIGLTAAGVVCLVDYHTISRWSFVAYWGSILVLILVLIPGIGSIHGGARRWIDLPFFQLQPSEFGKLAFILAMAHFLSRPPDELRQPVVFWKAICLVILPFLFIMKEPDLGSALVLLPTGLMMMLVAGTPRRYLVMLVSTVTLVGCIFLVDVFFAPPGWQIKLIDYQRDRLTTYFGVDFTPPNASPQEKARAAESQRQKSYQARQALISVGSGGLTGKGWHQGDQIALGFLPRGAAHTDFIFSVFAEEQGFIGSAFLLALYAAILFTGIKIAGQARDRLGKLLAAGVVTLIFSQVFINIGMNIRIMPVTGVPLPLMSYGGSSVLCSLIAIGLLQNVHIYRKGY